MNSDGMLLRLFLSFLKIGTFTFGGGYAMIPVIQREVIDRRGWLSDEEFINQLTVAQSMPGPISLNTSIFVGYKMRGTAGALAAMMGVVIPSFVIILTIVMCLSDLRECPAVDAAFRGMRPAVVALIAAPVAGFLKGMGIWRIAAAVLAALAVWLLGLSPILFLTLGAAAGVLYYMKGQKKE